MKRLSALFFMSIIGFHASAACNENACDSTIKRLYATNISEGVVYIEMHDSTSSLSCTPPEGLFLSLEKEHPLFGEIYSMLLASTISQSKVRVRIVEGSPNCEVAYAWIKSR